MKKLLTIRKFLGLTIFLFGILTTGCFSLPDEKGTIITLKPIYESKDEAVNQKASERIQSVFEKRLHELGFSDVSITSSDDLIFVELKEMYDTTSYYLDEVVKYLTQTGKLDFKFVENFKRSNQIIKNMDKIIVKYVDTIPMESDEDSETEWQKKKSKDSAYTWDDFVESAQKFMEEVDRAEYPFMARIYPYYSDVSNKIVNWGIYGVILDDKTEIMNWLLIPEVIKKLPSDIQISWSLFPEYDYYEDEEFYMLYFIRKKSEFSGENLTNIKLTKNNNNNFSINFDLLDEDHARIAKLTGENINRPLAIIIDNQVVSAPVINSRIRGKGVISLASTATFEEAKNLEILLKSGSLPIKLELVDIKDGIIKQYGNQSKTK